MTLSFTTFINGKPNYFIEKIWEGIPEKDIDLYDLIVMDYRIRFGQEWEGKNFVHHNPKIHTIREDTKNRWGAGCDIHFVINNRTPNRFQFAPVIKCVSVQTIAIRYTFSPSPIILIDDELVCDVKQLAINDGFDSVEDFFAYFNKDFTGKLINWTDLKY